MAPKAAKGVGKGKGAGKGKGGEKGKGGAGLGFNPANKYRHWCFTAYGFGRAECAALKAWPETDECCYLSVGLEQCPVTGRAHLQGYVEVKDQQRLTWMKLHPVPNNWHWEPRRWGSPREAAEYTQKDGQWWEKGERSDCRVNHGREHGGEKERERWAATAETIRSKDRWADVLEDFSIVDLVSRRLSWAKSVWENRRLKPFYLHLDAPGFKWQGHCARFWKVARADPRTLHWFIDNPGCSGKSALVKWLVANQDACLVPLDVKSLASLWQGQMLCVADVPREEVFVNYKGVENLKNALMNQTKYEVVTKYAQNPPHVAVFSNWWPQRHRLTGDRFHVINLEDVNDLTTLYDLFPPARFPEVLRVWSDGDPLRGAPFFAPRAEAAAAAAAHVRADEAGLPAPPHGPEGPGFAGGRGGRPRGRCALMDAEGYQLRPGPYPPMAIEDGSKRRRFDRAARVLALPDAELETPPELPEERRKEKAQDAFSAAPVPVDSWEGWPSPTQMWTIRSSPPAREHPGTAASSSTTLPWPGELQQLSRTLSFQPVWLP
jgi:hypothetical protein